MEKSMQKLIKSVEKSRENLWENSLNPWKNLWTIPHLKFPRSESSQAPNPADLTPKNDGKTVKIPQRVGMLPHSHKNPLEN